MADAHSMSHNLGSPEISPIKSKLASKLDYADGFQQKPIKFEFESPGVSPIRAEDGNHSPPPSHDGSFIQDNEMFGEFSLRFFTQYQF